MDTARGGYNFGWRIMEGNTCYDSRRCDPTGMTLPALEYDHGEGCAVTGGYVYRGKAIPELTGHYFYSDFCSGFLRSFLYAGGVAEAHTDWQIGSAGNILSFGCDGDGELYMISVDGRIMKIVRKSTFG